MILYLIFAVITAFWLRRLHPVFQRLNDFHWGFLVLVDIMVGFVFLGVLFVAGVIPARPMNGETISSFAGRHPWAQPLEVAIDTIFFVLTSQKDHCAKEAAKWVRRSPSV